MMNEGLRFHILRLCTQLHFGFILSRNYRMSLDVTSSMGKENEVCVSDIQRQTCMCYMLSVNVGRLSVHTHSTLFIPLAFSSSYSLPGELAYGCSNRPLQIICELWQQASRIHARAFSIFTVEQDRVSLWCIFHALKHNRGSSHTN